MMATIPLKNTTEGSTSQPDRLEKDLGEQQIINGFEAATTPEASGGSDKSNRRASSPAEIPNPRLVTDPPPNGGLRAWLHVVGGFMLMFNSWGALNAFGVFQTYYESGELFQRSSADISWIGSIQFTILMLMGVFVGPIYDRGYLRALLIVGGFLVTFGHMILSLCHTYWQVVLAQGFVIGIGTGCLFVPCVSLLPTYFSSRMGLALGLAYSGSSIGGIIYPIVMYNLLDAVGFAWAVRAMGFIALGTMVIPIAIMRMRVQAPQPRAFIDWSAFSDVPYLIFVMSTLVGMIGLTVFLFYISFYAVEQGLTNTSIGFYIVPILNLGSCFGRTVPNALSDKTGPFNIIAPCAIITGILMFAMIAVHNEVAIIVMALLGGFFSGVFVALPPVCFIPLIKDRSRIGTRIGMGYGIIALGQLVAGPGSGAILGTVEPLHWKEMWAFGGATFVTAGIIYFGLRVYRSGSKLMVKM